MSTRELTIIETNGMVMLNAFVPVIRHSETLEVGVLVETRTTYPHLVNIEEPGLLLGPKTHYRTGNPYYLVALAYWALRDEVGVWYVARYVNEDEDLGPFWFRPLHTNDGAGILDLVDGHLRFL